MYFSLSHSTVLVIILNVLLRTTQLHPTGGPGSNICPGASSLVSKSSWEYLIRGKKCKSQAMLKEFFFLKYT